MVLDRHVLTLDVADFVEAFEEGSGITRGGIGRPDVDETDDRYPRLLRARRKGPRHRRAAEERDELPADHSITSSARPSRVGGMVRPRAFAVFRLITSSILVAC